MKEYFSGVAKASHPDAGKFYWTSNNIVAMLVGAHDGCPEFRVVDFTSVIACRDGEPLDAFNTLMYDEDIEVFFEAYYPVCGLAHGGAFGPGLDIVAELTEDEIEYFVPRGE